MGLIYSSLLQIFCFNILSFLSVFLLILGFRSMYDILKFLSGNLLSVDLVIEST